MGEVGRELLLVEVSEQDQTRSRGVRRHAFPDIVADPDRPMATDLVYVPHVVAVWHA